MPLRRYSLTTHKHDDALKLQAAGHSPVTGGTAPPSPRSGSFRPRSRSVEKLPPEPILMEGPLKKKGARVNMWSSRHAVLRGARLQFYRKKEDESNKREVLIVPGCFVSEIREIPYQKRSLFEFRLHWPPHVSSTGTSSKVGAIEREQQEGGDLLDSDEEEDALARLADRTAKTAKKQKNRAAEIEQSEIKHQSSVSKGAAVAGVAITGVVVGAFTAGIGLVPYLAVVGAAVAAGGGAVAYTASKSGPSRLVLAADTEAQAIRWKAMLEMEIAVCEGRRPPPPPEIDLQDIERWIHSTNWRAVGVMEGGLRILEEDYSSRTANSAAPASKAPAKRCRKTQVVMSAAPIKVFLAFMNADGSMEGLRRAMRGVKILQQIDDHTDVIHFTLPQPVVLPHTVGLVRFAPRDFVVMRYWRLDDDGSYVICLNSITHSSCPETKGVVRGTLHSVFAIAPRKDYAEFEEDLHEALVTFIVEVEPKGLAAKFASARPIFADMILTQILDVKEYVDSHRFRARDHHSGKAAAGSHPHAGAPHRGQSFEHAGGSSMGGMTTPPFGSPMSQSANAGALPSSSPSSTLNASPTKRPHSISRLTDKLRGKRRHSLSRRASKVSTTGADHPPMTAAALRNTIQAKEYEVHRLEVEIGRSGGGGTGQRSVDLLQQLQTQLQEVEVLKQKYKSLTGREWHQHGTTGSSHQSATGHHVSGSSRHYGTMGSIGEERDSRRMRQAEIAADGGGVVMDDLDFDVDEGVPSAWSSKNTPQGTTPAREVMAKLAFILLFCGAFFAALHCRRLLDIQL